MVRAVPRAPEQMPFSLSHSLFFGESAFWGQVLLFGFISVWMVVMF